MRIVSIGGVTTVSVYRYLGALHILVGPALVKLYPRWLGVRFERHAFPTAMHHDELEGWAYSYALTIGIFEFVWFGHERPAPCPHWKE